MELSQSIYCTQGKDTGLMKWITMDMGKKEFVIKHVKDTEQ